MVKEGGFLETKSENVFELVVSKNSLQNTELEKTKISIQNLIKIYETSSATKTFQNFEISSALFLAIYCTSILFRKKKSHSTA